MPDYLYIFGFEAPDEARRNDRFGWDDENSDGLVIEADDEAAALAWGHQVSERFLEKLYQGSGMSWRDRGYLGWIERHPKPETDHWADQQRVRVGELPDFTRWLQLHGKATRRTEPPVTRHDPPVRRAEGAGMISLFRKLLGRGSRR